MNKDIKAWLDDNKRDYNKGMALLLSYSNKPALCQQLNEYRNPKLLQTALENLLKKSAPVAQTVSEDNLPEHHSTEPTKKQPGKIEQQLQQEWSALLKQISDIKQKLFFIGRNAVTEKANAKLSKNEIEQRREIAALLYKLNEDCLKNRDELQYFQTFGKLPLRSAEIKQEQPVEYSYQEKENTRKNVAKLKSKIARAELQIADPECEDLEKNRKHLAKWNAKLQTESAKLESLKAAADGK